MGLFDKCCGYVELRTGCFIIGYLQLVSVPIVVIVTIMGLVASSERMDNPDEKIRNVSLIAFIIGVIFVLSLIPLFAVTITLVVGLHKNKLCHVKIYLIYSLVFLVLYLLLTMTGLAAGTVNVVSIINQVVYYLLNVYYLLVIRSYWIQMKNGNIHPTG